MHIDTPWHINIGRRSFLKQALLVAGGIAGWRLLSGCSADHLSHIKGSIVGADHQTGHLLRNTAALPKPEEILETDVLIIGGGISGLSAGRWLSKHSETRVLLLEMDNQPGGNSRYGTNSVSAYPLGAHYLPVPDLRNVELIDFLRECGSIESINDAGLPLYNEYHLCHDPEERLFINGYWQEGLIPETGVPEVDKEQIKRFFREVEEWKQRKGADGLDAFAIPVHSSSNDAAFTELHNISFAKYLDDRKYNAPALHWYLEYSCKDDYGANLLQTSAWAGLHYFAARKGSGVNVTSATILTWPEGNGFLMDALKKQGRQVIRTSCLAWNVQRTVHGATVQCYNTQSRKGMAINAKKVIMATPVAVTKRLLPDEAVYQQLPLKDFKHTPWVIANLTINGLPQGNGMPLCWDNVLYGSPSVGYVNANHQQLGDSQEKVITYYLPLISDDPGGKRREIHEKKYEQWLAEIVAELEKAHPGITPYISHAEIWIWGHGMILPAPGFINGASRKAAATPIDNTFFFAHTDLSGISIFEEAFYQGINAAKQVIASL
jgi:hypothetical protein